MYYVHVMGWYLRPEDEFESPGDEVMGGFEPESHYQVRSCILRIIVWQISLAELGE